MPKIVILGSLKHHPYNITKVPAPVKSIDPAEFDPKNREKFDVERYYQEACKEFYPAIEQADEVWVYSPDRRIGEHTRRDLDYAQKMGKKVFVVVALEGRSEEQQAEIRKTKEFQKDVDEITKHQEEHDKTLHPQDKFSVREQIKKRMSS